MLDDPTIHRIQETVAERFGLDRDDLIRYTKEQRIVLARHVAMYLSRELTDASLPTIGRHFGGRNHTTVIHAVARIARLVRDEPRVRDLVGELAARIASDRALAREEPVRGLHVLR